MDSNIIDKKNIDEFNNSGNEGRPLKVGFFNRLLRDFTAVYTYLISVIPSLGTVKTNTISEYTSGSGVTIDSLLIQDGRVGSFTEITANASGTGASEMSSLQTTYSIRSTNVNHIVALPILSTVPTGAYVCGQLVNTGCELRPHVNDRIPLAYIQGATGGNELALINTAGATGSTFFEAIKLTYNKWVIKTWSNVGVATTKTADL